MDTLRYMLDTDTFSYVVSNRHPSVRMRFSDLAGSSSISSISYAESKFGALKKGSPRLSHQIEFFSGLIRILPWTDLEAEVYAEIRTDLEKRGAVIGGNDMLIAAAAMANDLTLVTNNTAHFAHIPGLQLENWIQ
jgi:tRNA(fMet)-specific endonuclease VapC